jgi:hypothetical protein
MSAGTPDARYSLVHSAVEIVIVYIISKPLFSAIFLVFFERGLFDH